MSSDPAQTSIPSAENRLKGIVAELDSLQKEYAFAESLYSYDHLNRGKK